MPKILSRDHILFLFCCWFSSAEASGRSSPPIPLRGRAGLLYLGLPLERARNQTGHEDRNTYQNLTRLLALFQDAQINCLAMQMVVIPYRDFPPVVSRPF